MSFFDDTEAANLNLTRMSLHIISGEDDFEPQPELPVEHDDFLLALLKDIATEPVYRFNDGSTTRETLQGIASAQLSFEEGAQRLAADFLRFHSSSNAKDGAFFVFELSTNANEDKRFYALIKYDYSQALELVHNEGNAGLRRIVEAFVSNKSSIQKSAIIRSLGGEVDALISTKDRMGRPSPNLTEFFLSFLQVSRDRDDAELTKAAKETVQQAIRDHRDLLPAGGAATAVSRANYVLRAADEISDQVINQAVWVGVGQPDDDATKARLSTTVARLLKKNKINGITFTPAASELPRTVRRQVMTREGVKIEYNTALEGQAVVVEQLPDGGTRFTITTESFRDDISADKARR